MEISEERFSIIGKIIRIHREERKKQTKSHKWTQDFFCLDVCSSGTLSNIEKGGHSRSPEIIKLLLEKIDLELGEYPDVDEAINTLIDQLYEALELSKRDDVIKITKKAKAILKKVNTVVYYSELYDIFDNLNIYIKKEVPFKESFVNRSLKMFKVLPEKLIDILKSLIFSSVYTYASDKEFLKISSALELEKSDYIGNRYNVLILHALNDNNIKFLTLCKELEEILKESKNYTRLFELYSMSIPLMSYIDVSMIPHYVTEIEALIAMNVIPDPKIADYFYHSGVSSLNEGAYSEAIEHFEKSRLHDDSNILTTVLLIAVCYRRLGQDHELEEIDKGILKNHPLMLQGVYEYFKHPINCPPFIKQEIIMNDIFPYLEKDESLFQNIMQQELEEVVKETSQYKAEHVYNVKSRKLLKKG